MTYWLLILMIGYRSATPLPERYSSKDECLRAAEVARNSHVYDERGYRCVEIVKAGSTS